MRSHHSDLVEARTTRMARRSQTQHPQALTLPSPHRSSKLGFGLHRFNDQTTSIYHRDAHDIRISRYPIFRNVLVFFHLITNTADASRIDLPGLFALQSEAISRTPTTPPQRLTQCHVGGEHHAHIRHHTPGVRTHIFSNHSKGGPPGITAVSSAS